MKALRAKKKVFNKFFITPDSKIYFRIGYLFTASCSDYLNFQDSAKNKNKNIQRVHQRKCALFLFYQRRKKNPNCKILFKELASVRIEQFRL